MRHRSGIIAGILLMSATPVSGQSPERDSLARQLALTMNVVAAVQEAATFPAEAATTMDSAIKRRMLEGSRSYVARYFTPDVVLAHVVPVYVKRFEEPELRKLIDFARSPAGARYLSEEAELRLIAVRVWQAMLKHATQSSAHATSAGGASVAIDSLARELLAAVAAARSQATQSTPMKMDEPREDQRSPRSAAARELMRGTAYRDAVDAALVREYAQRHSAAELRQLIDFFRSPLGVRFVVARVEADKVTSALATEINQKHSDEFQKIISDALPKAPSPP